MSNFGSKLLNISGPPLNSSLVFEEDQKKFLSNWGSLGEELCDLLKKKNGFYAYESSLLVRPSKDTEGLIGLRNWNKPERWISQYTIDLKEYLFFAEDMFGSQFAIGDNKIHSFDPEIGEFEILCSSIEEWCQLILDDYDFQTGWSLGRCWQKENGPIPIGKRLIPKIPFVLGGKFDIQNLVAIDDVKGMLSRANLANQIKNCPDGSQVIFEIIE